MENKKTKTPVWEMKDRTYILKGRDTPIVSKLPSKHTQRKPLLWLDPEKGYQRELRYATNQRSPLVEEQQGVATLGHIVFRNGALMVKKELQSLQKLLSLYHPLKDVLYVEKDDVKAAEIDLEYMELEVEALSGALQLSADQRVFTAGKAKRKLFTVPFDEHPYSALAAWFKTDEGMEVYKSMSKKVK